jgi:hypothetical protein
MTNPPHQSRQQLIDALAVNLLALHVPTHAVKSVFAAGLLDSGPGLTLSNLFTLEDVHSFLNSAVPTGVSISDQAPFTDPVFATDTIDDSLIEDQSIGDILADRLMTSWMTTHGKKLPWNLAVEIIAVCSHLPAAEKDRLLNFS